MVRSLVSLAFALPCWIIPSLVAAQSAPVSPPSDGTSIEVTGSASVSSDATTTTAAPALPPPPPGSNASGAPPQAPPVYLSPTPVYGAPTPVQPVYAPPVYAQPRYYQPASAYRYMSRDEIETRQRARTASRLTVAGGVTFGVMYGLTALVGLAVGVSATGSGQTEALVACIPVAGPFVAIGVMNGSTSYPHAGETALYVIDGLVQIAGASLLIAGIALSPRDSRTNRLTARPRRGLAAWSLTPVAPGASLGATLSLSTF